MSDELPPEGCTPWELLEVGPEASELEIRRGYARRIKRFRPDRKPAEFQRIHAAYEWALQHRSTPPEAPLPDSGSRSPPANLSVITNSDLDIPTRRAALDEVLASRDLDTILDVLGEPTVREDRVFYDGRIDWKLLRRHVTTDAATVAHVLAVQADEALIDGRLDVMTELLADPGFRADASTVRAVAILALRIACVVTWGSPDRALVAHWLQLPHDLGVAELLDRLDATSRAAHAWRQHPLVSNKGPVVELLATLLGETSLYGEDDWKELRDKFRPTLEDGALLAICDGMDDPLARIVEDLQRLSTPCNGRRLEDLPADKFELLGRELAGFDVHISLPPLVRSFGVAGRYKRSVRSGFAQIIGELGIQADVVVRWLRLNGRQTPTVAQFDLVLERDAQLAAFGAISERIAIGTY